LRVRHPADARLSRAEAPDDAPAPRARRRARPGRAPPGPGRAPGAARGCRADLERLAAVELSIVCFRYAPGRLRGDHRALDALNKRVMEDVQASGRAFLTQATLGGHFALRACVLHYATTESDLAALVDVVRET